MANLDPLKILREYFYIQVATTDELKKELYHFRYQIFCKEFGFEAESACPNQLEIDAYDTTALHAMLYHKLSNRLVGGLRILFPNCKEAPQSLPFEAFADDEQLPEKSNIVHFGEASRLAVHQDFRRRRFDGQHVTGINTKIALVTEREFPVVGLSMMIMGVALGNILQFEKLYAMMEPKLNQVMQGYGINFQQIGQLANYHGERAPFALEPSESLDTIHPNLAPLLRYVIDELDANLSDQRIA